MTDTGSVVAQGAFSAVLGYLPPWTSQAACSGFDLDHFDRELPSSMAMTRPVLDAKRVCYGCEVTAQCLAWSFEHENREMILGGMTWKERKALAEGPEPLAAGLALLETQHQVYGLEPVAKETIWQSRQSWLQRRKQNTEGYMSLVST